MLLDIVKKGSTDRSVTIRIIDSTDGTPETGVVYNTSGIDLWYRREGAAVVSITEATLANLTTAHTDGGFLHVGNGEYRLDLPDAAFGSGANHVDIGGTVTGMIVIGGRVRLVDYDPEDAVGLGLSRIDASINSRLPTASYSAPPSAASIRTEIDTNSTKLDAAISTRMATFTLPTNFSTLGINPSGHISRVVLVDTTTVNTDMRGTNNALLAASYTAPDNSSITAIKGKTDLIPNDPADASDIAAAFVSLGSAISALGTPAQAGDAMTLTSGERDLIANAMLDLANGVETSETVRQCMRLMRAALLGKLDGAEGTTVHMRDRADSKNRITATVDADGNRTAVTTDAS